MVSRAIRIVIEVVVYLITYAAYLLADSVPLTERGFFCDDPSLSLPFKKSTVRGKWLYINFYSVPVAIWVIELLLHCENIKKNLIKVTKRALIWFKDYFFTFMLLTVLMASSKNLAGRLRPFFFDVCRPDTALNCIKGTFVSADFNCTNQNTSKYMLFEVKRSFPSGHVVVIVFANVFFMWYLQKRISKFPILLGFVHTICLLWMMFCAVTRITDNWHHDTDVIGGFLMTLPFVAYLCHVQCKSFAVPSKHIEDKE